MRTVLLLPCLLLGCAQAPPSAEPAKAPVRACNPELGRSTVVSPESGRLEPFIYPVIEKVISLPSYSGHWVEHEPRYTFVVAFTRPPPLSQIKRLAPPEIRDRIAVRTAKRSRAELSAADVIILQRLRGAGLREWSSGYRETTQCFHITVESPEAAQRVRAVLPPDILIDTDIQATSTRIRP